MAYFYVQVSADIENGFSLESVSGGSATSGSMTLSKGNYIIAVFTCNNESAGSANYVSGASLNNGKIKTILSNAQLGWTWEGDGGGSALSIFIAQISSTSAVLSYSGRFMVKAIAVRIK